MLKLLIKKIFCAKEKPSSRFSFFSYTLITSFLFNYSMIYIQGTIIWTFGQLANLFYQQQQQQLQLQTQLS